MFIFGDIVYFFFTIAFRVAIIAENAGGPFIFLWYLNCSVASIQGILGYGIKYSAKFSVSDKELGKILGIPEQCCHSPGFYRTQIISMIVDSDPDASKEFCQELRERGIDIKILDGNSIVRSDNTE